MKVSRFIATLLLSFSIALAGFPAQAKPECPMATKMQQMAMADMEKAHDCDDCPKVEKQQSQKKSGCCDDAACNSQCSALSGGVTMNLPTAKNHLPAIGEQDDRFYPADAAMASAHLSSQERPPKSLS